ATLMELKGGASHANQAAIGDRESRDALRGRRAREYGWRQRQLGLTGSTKKGRGAATRGAPALKPIARASNRIAFPLFASCVLAGLIALIATGIATGAWRNVGLGATLFWIVFCATANLMSTPTATHTYLSMSAPVNIAMG